jgi:hypothetical protein
MVGASRKRILDRSGDQASTTPGAKRDGLHPRGRGAPLSSRKLPTILAVILSSLLTLAVCAGCDQAGGEQATGEPQSKQESKQDASAEARAGDAEADAGSNEGDEGDAVAQAGDEGGAVARAGDGGAVARAGDAVARAGGGAKARAGDAATGEGDAAAAVSSGGERNARGAREAALEIGGDSGTEFSGRCTVGDEENEIQGQVPGRFVFDLDGRKLECEIHKQSTGAMKIVLDAGGADYVQRTDSRRATIRIVYSGEGYSSSIHSSSGSTSQEISSDSSAAVSSSSEDD